MNRVIDRFAFLVSPLGPYGDDEVREKEESEWLSSMSTSDALELVDWIRKPSSLPGWNTLTEDNISGLRDMAAGEIWMSLFAPWSVGGR